MARGIRVIQSAVLMGDAFEGVGADHSIIQKLPLLMGHVGNQQGEKDVEPLDFCRQQRLLHAWAVQQFIH